MKLVVQGVSKAYATHAIFEDLSLSFAQEVNYLIAPNGMGKSTLLKIITGIESKDKGKILFNGKANRFSVYGSYVPDKMTMYPFVTGQEFLDLVYQAKQVVKGKDDIHNLLDELNITRYLDTPFEKMSLGTQKKFFVIAGFAGEFSCLVMDEPSNAIDRKSMEIIIRYLKEFSDKKIILIATHDQHLQNQLPGKVFNLTNNSNNND